MVQVGAGADGQVDGRPACLLCPAECQSLTYLRQACVHIGCYAQKEHYVFNLVSAAHQMTSAVCTSSANCLPLMLPEPTSKPIDIASVYCLRQHQD
jgi:hypothetical protein